MPSSIKPLSDLMIRQIAAGEVIERPASAVKEMLENALDAGATKVDIALVDAGKTLIQVRDNGRGMTAEELPLALQKHATSKLPQEDLSQINFFGFRGEALASISAVAKIDIVSRTGDADSACMISNSDNPLVVKPSAGEVGTTIQVKHLFHATPARLKFLRHERTEFNRTLEVIQHVALCAPHCAITLSHQNQMQLQYRVHATDCEEDNKISEMVLARLGEVMGQAFADQAHHLHGERGSFHLNGYIAPPAMHVNRTRQQYLCVNGRSVKDPQLFGAIRRAYGDLLPKGTHVPFCFFITCPSEQLDVNVHPAKTEVRFHTPDILRSLLVGTIRRCLDQHTSMTAPTVAESLAPDNVSTTIPAFASSSTGYHHHANHPSHDQIKKFHAFQAPLQETLSEHWQPIARTAHALSSHAIPPQDGTEDNAKHGIEQDTEQEAQAYHHYPLGAAKAHVLGNYIIAETEHGIVLIDQHAAHERIVYEQLKAHWRAQSITVQPLLVPEILRIDPVDLQHLLEEQETLAKLGLEFDIFGQDALVLRSVPDLLAEANKVDLLDDILAAIHEGSNSAGIEDRLFAILSRIACHGSIRAGRRLHAEEMNALLRQIETTPNGGHCNHGRPTQVFLSREKIEKLFGR